MEATMEWTLEVVVVPVSDVDRAKAFYADRVGFTVDHDTRIGEGQRVVQLTPPGSGCSIVIGEGVVPPMPPGALKGLQLVVKDVQAAHEELAERGVAVSDVRMLGENPGAGGPLDNVGFIYFEDPDGNAWAVQQISYAR
jgi:catechol 2,3-dioxygenase-like lactoylglutathione lyase family enzyme